MSWIWLTSIPSHMDEFCLIHEIMSPISNRVWFRYLKWTAANLRINYFDDVFPMLPHRWRLIRKFDDASFRVRNLWYTLKKKIRSGTFGDEALQNVLTTDTENEEEKDGNGCRNASHERNTQRARAAGCGAIRQPLAGYLRLNFSNTITSVIS